MVAKSIFKQRKYKVNKNKLTKKKAKKLYKHTGGQNTTNLKVPTNQNQETLPSNETENQEYLNNSGNEELMENNMNQETLSDNQDLENENNTQPPAVGLYNNLNQEKPETELSKAIRKERGGLFISYPPEINGDKEKAIAEKLNLTNTREPGFTSYRGEIDDKIEPKFEIDNFYPKYLSYYKLSENTQSNNMSNMSNMGNMSNMSNMGNMSNMSNMSNMGNMSNMSNMGNNKKI
jgi:hypothetical protein